MPRKDNIDRESSRKPLSVKKLARGVWIEMKRHEKRFTRYHLASKMGIPSSLIRAWESGESEPDAKQCRILNVMLA